MRWCRIEHEGAKRHGIVSDDVIEIVEGSPFGVYRLSGQVVPVEGVVLAPPVIPASFLCVGMNYTSHIKHAQLHGMSSVEIPTRPEVGYRASSALIGHGQPIVKPADCEGRFETEGELVAVIGRGLRRCTRDEAIESVFGWTIGNDVSARNWQHSDRSFWRAKNSDTFKPMGPWITTDVDPMHSRTEVRVNGEVRAEFSTGAMIFDPYDYLVELSKYVTVSPGDVLWMGTDAMVAMAPGDTVDISISGIGTLSNPIESEVPPTAVRKEQ
ncbi:2-keto-4-pentenoate hydratase [Rhodococcus sp. ACPA4]|uniref:fumarylacetoacetate hydrolase family protein n=1 Tax=Rhodococcus sp. ACPA4 TaxID=2028571 RepID=UPI000BB10F48|nr:fumarylacetoacetate hydrolase family protein [Rhodococcus sp. ACPA4]PBC43506.1 2-keto-4-pentenoate hydratase [Rhodococcus sp. ACPA4]